MSIKEARKAAGMTRKQVTERLKIPYRTLQDWELGNNRIPEYIKILLEIFYKTEGKKMDAYRTPDARLVQDFMQAAWEQIESFGITEDPEAKEANPDLWLVKDIHKVRDAFVADYYDDYQLTDESDTWDGMRRCFRSGDEGPVRAHDDADVSEFLNRHGIEWE